MTVVAEVTEAGRRQLELLASTPFSRLWDRVQALVERRGLELGESAVSLPAPTEAERLAISGLLGRPRSGGATLRVRLADLDARLREGPLGAGIANVLALLGRSVRDRGAEAEALQRAIDDAQSAARASRLRSEAWFVSWLDGLISDGTVKRLVNEASADLLELACRAFEAVPADGIPLPVFATRITGTTKGLDAGILATLVLRGLALRAGVPKPVRAAERRALWESFGVVADDLSSDVLVLNLPVVGRTRLDDWLRGAAADGMPMRITLHQLVSYHLEARPAHVWICENPAVIRAATRRHGGACAPMVCSEGQPSTAFDMLLDALARHGCEFAYHGDFDWPGVRIAAAIRSRHGVAMWRMGRGDYQSALQTLDIEELPELSGDTTSTVWDPELSRAMNEAKRAVFEESVIDTLIEDVAVGRAPTPTGRARTSVRELIGLGRCGHRVHLDRHGDPGRKANTSAFLELLWNDLADHEEILVRRLEAARIDRDAPANVRLQRTLELMRAGSLLIAGGRLDIGDLSGNVPLLKRIDEPSELGAHAYLPAVVRATSSDPESGAGERQALALCGFAELLDYVQRWRPTKGILIGRDGVETDVELDAFRPRYQELRRRMRRVLAGIEPTQPGLKTECRLCAWREYCHEQLVNSDDLTLVPTVGESERARLRDIGLSSRQDLAAASSEKLESFGIGKRRAATLIRTARVQMAGVPEILAPWARPHADLELAYDIEDDLFEPYTYLHGLLFRASGRTDVEYDPVCARLPELERDLWSRFVGRIAELAKHESFCVYVYGSHERTMLRRLAQQYGGGEIIEPFVAHFVDVYDAIKKTVVLPTESMSLKAVATWLGFNWRDPDPSGAESIAWWAEYAGDPIGKRSLLDRILAYNEDDLRATIAVVDWLARNAR
jgi:uncharacterized protein (TIGR02679 family)